MLKQVMTIVQLLVSLKVSTFLRHLQHNVSVELLDLTAVCTEADNSLTWLQEEDLAGLFAPHRVAVTSRVVASIGEHELGQVTVARVPDRHTGVVHMVDA